MRSPPSPPWARRTGLTASAFSPHFFALGAAFLLIETRSLVSFSLLFGSTWIVNSLVFFGILLSVLAAIGVTAVFKPRRRGPIYAMLFVALGIGFALDPASLLIDPPIARYVVAATVTFAPIFLANLAFTYAFRDTAQAEMSFASNVLGAVAGGAIEYLRSSPAIGHSSWSRR